MEDGAVIILLLPSGGRNTLLPPIRLEMHLPLLCDTAGRALETVPRCVYHSTGLRQRTSKHGALFSSPLARAKNRSVMFLLYNLGANILQNGFSVIVLSHWLKNAYKKLLQLRSTLPHLTLPTSHPAPPSCQHTRQQKPGRQQLPPDSSKTL